MHGCLLYYVHNHKFLSTRGDLFMSNFSLQHFTLKEFSYTRKIPPKLFVLSLIPKCIRNDLVSSHKHVLEHDRS